MKILQGGVFALGFTLGMCGTILAFLLLGLFSEVLKPTSELWSVMFGAVLGGGIALAGQVLESQNRAAQIETEKNEIDLARAYDLFGILNECLSHATFLRKHIEDGFLKAEKEGFEFESIGIMELSSKPKLPKISFDVKSMLIRRKFLSIYNKIGLLDARIDAVWENYWVSQRKRFELLALLDTDMIATCGEFQPLPGKEVEAKARNLVLCKGFERIATDLIKDEEAFQECMELTVEIVKSMGDKSFEFEFQR